MTKEWLENHIVSKETLKMWDKTTVCLITLDNGFEVVGTSHCINPSDFDLTIWEKVAYDNAVEKLWDLYWFLSHCDKKLCEDSCSL